MPARTAPASARKAARARSDKSFRSARRKRVAAYKRKLDAKASRAAPRKKRVEKPDTFRTLLRKRIIAHKRKLKRRLDAKTIRKRRYVIPTLPLTCDEMTTLKRLARKIATDQMLTEARHSVALVQPAAGDSECIPQSVWSLRVT